MKDTCQQNDALYQLLGTTGVAVLFIFSEVLPFIKSIKSNGILDFIAKTLSKQKDEEATLIDVP